MLDRLSAAIRRKQGLADIGYIREVGGGQLRAPTDIIAQLERTEINRFGKAFAAERGLEWRLSLGPKSRRPAGKSLPFGCG